MRAEGLLYEISYGQIHLTHPKVSEMEENAGGSNLVGKARSSFVLPDECRKKNWTYASLLQADLKYRIVKMDKEGRPTEEVVKELVIRQVRDM